MGNEAFRIRLEAKNPEKGHLRAYRIDAGHRKLPRQGDSSIGEILAVI